MSDLIAKLNALCDEQPFTTSWYFKDLKTGETADRAGDIVVPSASTRKISIMMTALAACHAGSLSLDQPFSIEAKYQDTDSGTFQFLTPGFEITFRDALVMMIIVSRQHLHRQGGGHPRAGRDQRLLEARRDGRYDPPLQHPAEHRPRSHAGAGQHHHPDRCRQAAGADPPGHHR